MNHEKIHESSFSKLSFTALKWNYFGSVSRSGLQFLIGIVLARLLGPQPFGLVVVAVTVLGLGSLISDFGLGSALIQRKEITRDDIRFVFTLQVITGLILTITVFLLAGPIGRFFHQPDAVSVVQVMSPMFLISSAGQTAGALLRRNLDFKRYQLAQFKTYMIGYVMLGIPLAFLGFGVWSLVIAQLSQASFNSMTVYLMVKHPVAPCFKSPSSELFNFGLKYTASNLGSWGFTSIDNIVIGRMFGVVDMGLYNRASILVSNPVGMIVTSMQGVLFSASARKQDDITVLRRTYLGVLGIMAYVCLPLFVAVAVVPSTVINGIYGIKWITAAPLLIPLSLAQPVFALLALGGPVMAGMGKSGREMWVQFIALGFFALLLWWASRHSVEAVAWAALAACLLRFFLVTAVTLKSVDGKWSSVIKSLAGPFVLALFTAGATYFADVAVRWFSFPPLLHLTIVALTAATATFLIFTLLRHRLVAPPVVWLLNEVAPQLPKPLRALFSPIAGCIS